MIAIKALARVELERILSRTWGSIEDRAVLVRTTAAEHMRAMIYGAIASARSNENPTVHTIRLLKGANRAIELLWPDLIRKGPVGEKESLPEVVTDVLRHMESIGDAVDTGGGRWLATPLRLISLNNVHRYLVVGTAPAQQIHRLVGMAPQCSGVSRFVNGPLRELTGESRDLISVDAWFGQMLPLIEWTNHILTYYGIRMQSMQGLSAEKFEIYAPDVTRQIHKSGRWISAQKIEFPLDGIRLCRPMGNFISNAHRPQYLAKFRHLNGSLTLRSSVPIDNDLSLRLRFGLDVLLKTPRTPAIVREGKTFSMPKPPRLPTPEDRVYALGWPSSNSVGATQGLTFYEDALPFVVHAFRRLSIEPTVAMGGRAR